MKFLENLHNGKGHKKQLATLSLTVLLALSGMGMSYAADTADGSGKGVAIGTESNAPKEENVAIGKGATISYSNGDSNATGDVAIGNGANINNYASQGGSVAIGKNAKVENMAGSQERIFAFGQTKWNQKSIFGYYYGAAIPEDPSKAVSSIAIGDNTYARTGSVMIGPHNYNGDLGDKTVNMEEKNTLGVDGFATTIGANSYTNGAFATTTGAYNIISGSYSGGNSDSSKASQNFGATITGSLNSIESATSSSFYSGYSGIANSIVGVANRTNNSNGSLIFGAGNVITNSITDLDGTQEVADSAKKFQQNLIDSVKAAESGGAALAIGGSNTIDYAQKSQVMGVDNTLTGENGNISKFNFIDGYKNSAEKVNNAYIIGANNEVKNGNNNIVFGDNYKMDEKSNNVVIGSADKGQTLLAAGIVQIGHNAKVTQDSGIAIGEGSLASIAEDIKGWDPVTGDRTVGSDNWIWTSTRAALSIGDTSNGITRQITGVAAGLNDTDAVNVAQLKKAMENAGGKIDLVAGNGIKIDEANGKYTISANVTGGTTTTDVVNVTPKTESGSTGTGTGTGTGSNTSSTSGKALEVTAETKPTTFKADSGSADIKPSETLSINGDSKNISTEISGTALKVKLADDVSIKSVTASDSIKVAGGPSMSTSGIDAAGKKITNVAAGTADTDAVNVSQLKGVEKNINNINQTVNNMGGRISKLDNRLDKVGAGAAALAALHPQDFDPDDKWDVAAGYGNYKDANAAAVGAFYHPNEDTMISVGGSFGGGENMVNAGVSVKLGQGNHVTTSRVAMAREILDMKQKMEKLEAQNQYLMKRLGAAPEGALKDVNFPDVPKDHWAYQYVKTLADKGYIEGYPDGEFKGDRAMTRYEYAAVIYRALQNGAPVDDKMAKVLDEFEPELDHIQKAARFRVDRISGKDEDRGKVERVRVNNDQEERDVYGGKIPAALKK